MEYISERRGGWDEWSDEYKQITGLRLDNGDEIRGRYIDDMFTDKNNTPVKVELPMRMSRTYNDGVTVERHEPEYQVIVLKLGVFSEYINLSSNTIDFESAVQDGYQKEF